MIDLVVSLNGEEFEVRAQGDVYNGELPDFNAAVKAALHAQFLAHPLDPLDSASLEVSVRRVYTETAFRDGVFEDAESPRADRPPSVPEPEDESDDTDEDDERLSRRQESARKAAATRRANREAAANDECED